MKAKLKVSLKKPKKKKERYMNIIIVSDAGKKPRTIEISKWLFSLLAAVLLLIFLLSLGTGIYYSWFGDKLRKKEGEYRNYFFKLAQRDGILENI